MSKLNPRVDFAFKKLFGAEENKDLLVSFINSIVSEEDKVRDVVLLNPYNHPDYHGDKTTIMDIKATDKSGRQYNIEMQMIDQLYYDQRALYYWSKLYTSQLKEGYRFNILSKTICIHVLNFNFLPLEEDFHSTFRIFSVKTQKGYFEDFELRFIELEKFDKDIPQAKTALERWVSFLKKPDLYGKNEMPKIWEEDAAIKKAVIALDTMYLTPVEQEVYEGKLAWLRDEAAAVEEAKLEAKAEAKIEGKTEATLAIAQKMLGLNITVADISQATGLSESEINKIKN